MLDPEQTICAVASAPGPAVRGVIRISGPDTACVLERLLANCFPQSLGSKRSRALKVSLDLGEPLGSVPAQVLYWPTSRSYTGQPSAELHLIGAGPVLQQTLARLTHLGARLAEPGEFTLRSFLAGRIDLTQAEAVLGVIEAETRSGLHAALDQLTGGISQPLDALRNQLLELLADVEAALDFVDEDIQFIDDETLAARLQGISDEVHSIAQTMNSRQRASELPLVVLWGYPNAGKSSLLNRLAGSDTAIVADVVGTTRDPVEVRLTIGEQSVRIVDTAGMERLATHLGDAVNAGGTVNTADISEQAQQLAMAMLQQADVRLCCVDARMTDAEVPQVDGLQRSVHTTDLKIATKGDLVPSNAARRLQEAGWIVVSSLNDVGIDRLIAAVAEGLAETGDEPQSVGSTAARCRESLENAAAGLLAAANVVQLGEGQEFVAAELRLAIDAIGQVTGKVYTDDILDKIFSRFCIGK